MASKKQNNTVAVGVGLTAAAVAAAGAYFLYGSKDAKQNRAKIKSWTLKAKAEVLEALENAEEMTEKEFNQLVETVSKSYAGVKSATKSDVAEFKRDMKKHWPEIVKHGAAAVATVQKVAKKPAKKSAKKSTKKTTKKAAKKSSKKTTKKTAKK